MRCFQYNISRKERLKKGSFLFCVKWVQSYSCHPSSFRNLSSLLDQLKTSASDLGLPRCFALQATPGYILRVPQHQPIMGSQWWARVSSKERAYSLVRHANPMWVGDPTCFARFVNFLDMQISSRCFPSLSARGLAKILSQM